MKIIYDGSEVDLVHMTSSMEILCQCAELDRELKIRVAFQNHCYTEKFDPRIHTREQICLTEGKDRDRVFCPIRYALSHRLRGLIEALPERKVHQTGQVRNYVYVVLLEIEKQHYEIYFMLQRAAKSDKADLRLTVESAYPNGGHNLRKRPREIQFAVLAHKVLTNQQIRFAAR